MTLQERLAPGKYRLTVDDYQRLDDAGTFGSSRTELLDGDIIVMNAEYRPHAWVRGELWYCLRQALEQAGSDIAVTSASVRTSAHDMPLPDIVLTREPMGEGPVPLGSVALIVEVSSTTLRRDMAEKAAIYARAGVPEYWVCDVDDRTIHQFWSPEEGRYVQQRPTSFGKRLTAVTLADLAIDTSRL